MKITIAFCAWMCAFFTLSAQIIPNSGFENWSSTAGYNTPDGWATLNSATAPLNVFTCAMGTPGSPGTSYMKLTSRNIMGVGVVPGLAVSGTIDVITQQASSGFACNVRPSALTGKWQYMGGNMSDIGFIHILFTRWNSMSNMRDTIGSGQVNLNGMVMSWSPFSVPISFSNSMNPDSCMIVMSASGATPAVNSYLYVDALDFSVVSSTLEQDADDVFAIYPQPASDYIMLKFPKEYSLGSCKVACYDLAGHCVLSTRLGSALIQSVNIESLPPGIYLIDVVYGVSRATQRLIKQ